MKIIKFDKGIEILSFNDDEFDKLSRSLIGFNIDEYELYIHLFFIRIKINLNK